MKRNMSSAEKYLVFKDPPFAQALFDSTKFAVVWLVIRLYVGVAWIEAGWGKLNNPAWTGENAGTALTGFLSRALQKASGDHPDVQGWYAWFLQNVVLPNATMWSYVIACGEFLVGLALILGLFTGIAAFFGSFMNLNFLLAGTVSSNPILFSLATLLVLAWKVAGHYGLDRYALPALGTPWRPGKLFGGG